MIRFPKPLHPGALIAVTAPSSGVPVECHARLELVIGHLRELGYRVREGECLREQRMGASGPRAARAAELARFLTDPKIAVVMPPWGGELAIDLLQEIDFDALRRAQPKWFCGYSDISTLLVPLTMLAGWATVHGPNLMDLAPAQTDPLTTGMLGVLATPSRESSIQNASPRFQKRWIDFAERPDAPFDLAEPARWRRLDGGDSRVELRGRLIGGCLDTLARLAGTRYGDIPRFVRSHADDGVLLYLENAEMNPSELARALWGLRLNGWFVRLAGLLIGRSAGPDAIDQGDLTYNDALHAVLDDLPFPVVWDVDIGHQPPQFTLVNGALAEVRSDRGGGHVRQWFA